MLVFGEHFHVVFRSSVILLGTSEIKLFCCVLIYLQLHTPFFNKNTFKEYQADIWFSILAISQNILLEIYLNWREESFRTERNLKPYSRRVISIFQEYALLKK